FFFFFSSRRRHTRSKRDWSSDVCSSDLFFLGAQLQTGTDGLINGHQNFLILAVVLSILLHQHQNVVNVDLHLLDQFHLKNNIIHNTVFVAGLGLDLLVYVVVCTGIVLKIDLRQNLMPHKTIKRRQDIPQAQDITEQNNEILFVLLSQNGLSQREALHQLLDPLLIPLLFLALIVNAAIVIIFVGLQQDDAARILIAKQRDGIIGFFFQIPETDNIAEGFDRIQDTVGPGKCLDQAVHFQVFVYPKGIQGGGIKTSQEHIDHQQK